MFMLLYVAEVLVVYIVTFKPDFTDEHIAKITPVLVALAVIFVFIVVLGLAGWGAK